VNVLIIPAFNEVHRTNFHDLYQYLTKYGLGVIFVNDGSTDQTLDKIELIVRKLSITFPKNVYKVISLASNKGKSHALHAGLKYSQVLNFQYALTIDIDTPFSVADGLKALKFANEKKMVLVIGARVMLSGVNVNRDAKRQWISRLISTLTSGLHSIRVYDPQSPCKVYDLIALNGILNLKFKTRWFHDIEMFIQHPKFFMDRTFEFTLEQWKDVADSALGLGSIKVVIRDLFFLHLISYRYSFQKLASKIYFYFPFF
jgi:glycosyltransferase involved in cell wall biosynthesis